jgi:hypothetical protein
VSRMLFVYLADGTFRLVADFPFLDDQPEGV